MLRMKHKLCKIVLLHNNVYKIIFFYQIQKKLCNIVLYSYIIIFYKLEYFSIKIIKPARM